MPRSPDLLTRMSSLPVRRVILEIDPSTIANRATMRGASLDLPVGSGSGGMGGAAPLEKSLASAFMSAKETLTKSLLR